VAQLTATLQCVECHVATVIFERGWRAYLTAEDADEPDEPVEMVVLCPDCAGREFGG
jgi:hypothetical protein